MTARFTATRIAAFLAAVAVIGFLAWGLFKAFAPQPLPLQGQIEAQEVNVSSKIAGRVGVLHVRLGQVVNAGDVLFELDSPEVQAKLVQARSAQSAALAQSAKAQAGARPEEIDASRLAWQRAQTAAQLAKLTYERVHAMFLEGVVAGQKNDEARAQWRSAEQQSEAARAQYQMVRQGARLEDRQAATAQAQQTGGVVAEAEVAWAETNIKAPAGGEVNKIQIRPGELAPQGFPVITLVDRSDIWAVLQVREDVMAAFGAGSRHVGEVPALKRSVEFSVSSVAAMSEFATWRAARPGGTDLRTFEIRLRPVGPVPQLRPGMGVIFAAP